MDRIKERKERKKRGKKEYNRTLGFKYTLCHYFCAFLCNHSRLGCVLRGVLRVCAGDT